MQAVTVTTAAASVAATLLQQPQFHSFLHTMSSYKRNNMWIRVNDVCVCI